MAVKSKIKIQDDVRESCLISMFKLDKLSEKRIGIDAYYQNLPFELKSTSIDKVATSRDVNIQKITEWRKLYWLIGSVTDSEFKGAFNEIYLVTPNGMKQWLDGIEKRLQEGQDVFDLINQHIDLNKILTEKQKKRYDSCVRRGVTLNSQKIPWKYVKENGILMKEPFVRNFRKAMKNITV